MILKHLYTYCRSVLFTARVGAVSMAIVSTSIMAQGASTHPELGGIWQVSRETSMTSGGATRPTDGKPIPFQPWSKALWEGAEYSENVVHRPWPPNNQRCLVAGTFRAMKGNFPFRLIQTDEQITLLFEEDGRVNVWPFKAAHDANVQPSWYGDPVARWNGDSLVVDVIGFNGKTPFPNGIVHTMQLHVVHNFRLINDGKNLEDRVRIEDPGAFTRPWETLIIFDRKPQGYKLRDYRCAENNRDLPPVLNFWGEDWGPR